MAVNMRHFYRDVDLQKDRKFYRLRLKYGYWAIAVYEELLCLIYSDKGYYIEYNENTKAGILFEITSDFQGKYQPSIETVDNIISDLVEYQLFSDCHFKSGYLTSHRIQESYYRYTVERKKAEIDFPEIWLLSISEMEAISSRNRILSFFKNQPNLNENRSILEENQPISETTIYNYTLLNNTIQDKTEDVSPVVVSYQRLINKSINNKQIEKLEEFEKDIDIELMIKGIEITAENNKGYSYLAGIYNNWKQQGIKTINDYEQHEKTRNERKTTKSKFVNYEQSGYDYDKLAEFEHELLERELKEEEE